MLAAKMQISIYNKSTSHGKGERSVVSKEAEDVGGWREKKGHGAKRLSKEFQAHKLKDMAKQKKEDIESVKKWRKKRQD